MAAAIAVGFGIAALAFAVALVVGWRLLSRERIPTGDKVTPPPAEPPTRRFGTRAAVVAK